MNPQVTKVSSLPTTLFFIFRPYPCCLSLLLFFSYSFRKISLFCFNYSC